MIRRIVRKMMMQTARTVLEIANDYDYQGVILSQAYQRYQGQFFTGWYCQTRLCLV